MQVKRRSFFQAIAGSLVAVPAVASISPRNDTLGDLNFLEGLQWCCDTVCQKYDEDVEIIKCSYANRRKLIRTIDHSRLSRTWNGYLLVQDSNGGVPIQALEGLGDDLCILQIVGQRPIEFMCNPAKRELVMVWKSVSPFPGCRGQES